jgi:methionyl-tRNA synthetase
MIASSIFISTTIPYVNGAPHVGFAWELVLADVLARFHRARGRSVTFLTGTDDNSLKNVRAAEAEGAIVSDFVRARGERFVDLCRALGLSNDDFIRTAFDPRHAPAVERLWRACDARGDIYRARYGGAYCVGCEQFYAPHEGLEGRCPEHDCPLEHIDEDNYFFRLSQHRETVGAALSSEPLSSELLSTERLRIWPEVYRAESRRWIEAGLDDFSVSRSTRRARGWGIRVPGDSEQTVYVWFDALVNYVSALGYGSDAPEFTSRWQRSARRIHVIGKNVTRFHCIYWPAILASAGLSLPSDIVVHGFLTVEGRKIGKSLGNGVDPFVVVERFGAERLRHYLLRHFPLGRDGDFSIEALAQACDDELADQLGNLQNRLLVLLEQHGDGVIPDVCAAPTPLALEARGHTARAIEQLESCDPHQALGSVFALVRACNLELSQTEPWRLARLRRQAKDDSERLRLQGALLAALGDAARGLLWAGALLEPFLPDAAQRIARAFGTTLPAVYGDGALEWALVGAGSRIQRSGILFEKVSETGRQRREQGQHKR